MSTKTNRRELLRGAAGLGLAMPFLPSLAPREARAATPPVRKKFVALWTPNGQRQEQWTPLQPATQVYPGNVRELALDTFKDTGISPVLGPAFTPFLPKMTFLKG